MLGKVNSGLIFGILKVSCPNSATVTITNGNLSFSNTGTYSEFKLPRTGDWTIRATFNGLTETYTRTVNAGQTVSLTVLTNIHIYHNQTYQYGFSGTFNGWHYRSSSQAPDSYNPIEDNHVHAAASGTSFRTWARSTMAINLTGIRQVKFGGWGKTTTGGNDGDGKFAVHITDASGNLLAESGYQGGGDQEYPNLVLTLDVSSINRTGYFQIYAEHWAYGSAVINLYDIWLIA